MLKEILARLRDSHRQSVGSPSRRVLRIFAADLHFGISFIFVISSVIVLFLSREESPLYPLRMGIHVYVLQCAFHIVLVCMEMNRQRWHRILDSKATWYLHVANQMFQNIWFCYGFKWAWYEYTQAPKDSAPLLRWFCLLLFGFELGVLMILVLVLALVSLLCVALGCRLLLIYVQVYAMRVINHFQLRRFFHGNRRLALGRQIPPCPFCKCLVPSVTFARS